MINGLNIYAVAHVMRSQARNVGQNDVLLLIRRQCFFVPSTSPTSGKTLQRGAHGNHLSEFNWLVPQPGFQLFRDW